MRTFEVKRVREVQSAITLLPVFMSALEVLNSIAQPGREVKPETFCRVILNTVGRGDALGHVALYGAQGENLGVSVTYASNDVDREGVAIVYAVCTFGTTSGLTRFMQSHIEKWARGSGFRELQAFSPRINGKGMALFEKRWGFRRWLLHYYKEL